MHSTPSRLHSRFFQRPRNEVSLVGVVERPNIKLELIADLCKSVNISHVMTARSPTYANKVVEVD